MKKSSVIALALLVLPALFGSSPAMAQMPALAPAHPTVQVPAPVPSTADFLASLAAGQPGAQSPDAVPAPTFLTSCTSSSQCPNGQLCCPACGQPECGTACIKPMNGHCPHFV